MPVFAADNNLKPFITNDLKGGGEIVQFRLPNGQKSKLFVFLHINEKSSYNVDTFTYLK